MGSYLSQTSAKVMEMLEKENKDKYLQPSLERRHNLTPMVYTADRIPGTEAVFAQQNLASILRNKLKREYSEMCDFVRARMSLVVVRSNTLLFPGARAKEVYIRQKPDLKNRAVMILIALWRG